MSRQNLTISPQKSQAILPKSSPPPDDSSFINPDILAVFDLANKIHKDTSENVESLKISSSLGYAAYIYEQFRNIIDNKSDHLLRRNAIERILKRLLWENSQNTPSRLAQQLIKELVWSRYFPNNSISPAELIHVEKIISKYGSDLGKKTLISALASAEIEEHLDPSLGLTEVLCQTMQNWFDSRFTWNDPEIVDEQKKLIIFVATRKVLVKSDNARIGYQLIKSHFPSWSTFSPEKFHNEFPQISQLLNEVKNVQTSPIFNKLFRLMTKQTAQFLMIKDLIETKPEFEPGNLSNKELLDSEIGKLCKIRYARIQNKVTTGIIRSVVYIFATKMLFVLLLEVPYELITAGKINFVSLSMNLAIPPILMVIVGLGIQKPNDKNTQTVIKRVDELVYSSTPAPQPFSLINHRQNEKSSFIFNIVYSTFAIIIFSAIVALLIFLHFNFIGIVVFFLFLSLVLLFGFRVGFAATELHLDSPHKSTLINLFEQFSLPFLNLGVFLSKGLDQLNFLTTIMDIIFEMPLKTFIDIINRWSDFVSNKRAEIVEVPIQ